MVEIKHTTSFKVVAICSDTAARSRIVSVLQRIHDKTWPGVKFEIVWTTFDCLENPLVKLTIAHQLRNAEIVCVATRPGSLLRPSLRNWLLKTPFAQTGHRALIALLEICPDVPANGTMSETGEFLERVAAAHGMDFLPYYTADLSVEKVPKKYEPWSQSFSPGPRRASPGTPPQVSSLNE